MGCLGKRVEVFTFIAHIGCSLWRRLGPEWHERKEYIMVTELIFNRYSRCLHKSKCINICRVSICH